MATTKLARICEEAAHQHDRAAAHNRHSARHLAKGEHTATAKERDMALNNSDKARVDEIDLRPDGMKPDGMKPDDRTKSEAAWHVTG